MTSSYQLKLPERPPSLPSAGSGAAPAAWTCIIRISVLDEAEYSEAVQALVVATMWKLAGCRRMGWHLPWGVTVRVCEPMLAGEWRGGRERRTLLSSAPGEAPISPLPFPPLLYCLAGCTGHQSDGW